MGTHSANQHLRVYVSTAAAAKVLANDGGTTDNGLEDATAFPAGAITYWITSGASANTGVATPPTDGSSYRVVYKDLNGIIHMGPVIDSSKLEMPAKATAYSAPVEQVDDLTIPATVVVGDTYLIKLRVPNYGGLVSPQDEVFFYGSHVAVTGDTATTIAAALAANLQKNLDKAPVPIATATSSGAVVTVTGLAQPYVKALFDGRQVNFDLSLALPADKAVGKDATSVAPKPGYGTGKQVASLEEFYAGYNTGYKDRYHNWPAVTEPTLAADAAGTYNAVSITFSEVQSGQANVVGQRQTILCFFKQ